MGVRAFFLQDGRLKCSGRDARSIEYHGKVPALLSSGWVLGERKTEGGL